MSNISSEKHVLAIDFGASGGRAMIGSFDGGSIGIQEIHRFSNDPVFACGTMYWDVLRLLHEIKQSLVKAKEAGGIESVAVDTWGVDFGLLDADGKLLENPVHYRDARTAGMLEKAGERIPQDRLYAITGNQFMEINTAFQLLSLRENRPGLLKHAGTMLMMPDLFNYFLSGEKVSEASIASTSQLFDMNRGDWSREVIGALGIPERIFVPVTRGGTVVGSLTGALCHELGIEPAKVIAVAGHDTQSALVATPAREKDFIFLSCGTWSLLGTELDQPIISPESLRLNITNESAYGGKISFMKNIIGLWMIQESRRQWKREGKDLSYPELERLARDAQPFRCFIDPDAPLFVPPGDIPQRIRQYCVASGQPVPENEDQVVRCIYDSLALKYRQAMGEIEACTQKRYSTIYMVGGGAKDKLLCEMTADACGCTVSAGPVEATALGNVAVQLMAMGAIGSLEEARSVIAKSQDIRRYQPSHQDEWEKAYARFIEVTKCPALS